MSYAAKTLFAFGCYLVLIGLLLLTTPNLLLGLFHVPLSSEVWIRVVGMLTLFLSAYYFVSARAELRPIFACSVPVRISMFCFCGGFVLLGMAPAVLMLFGLADLAGAAWTWTALRQPAKA